MQKRISWSRLEFSCLMKYLYLLLSYSMAAKKKKLDSSCHCSLLQDHNIYLKKKREEKPWITFCQEQWIMDTYYHTWLNNGSKMQELVFWI